MSKIYDVCVIGGGVIGLWVAYFLSRNGLSIALVEKKTCGSGASGGVLGALMAYSPENWSNKKQFQFDALVELPKLIESLEEETAQPTGYMRCGRIMPIRKLNFLERADLRSSQADKLWCHGNEKFSFNVVNTSDKLIDGDGEWLASEFTTYGHVLDTLTARVNPKLYTTALKARLLTSPHVDILEHWTFGYFDETHHTVYNREGTRSIISREIVLTAGYQTFAILQPIVDRMIGNGIKGQAAVFICPNSIENPLIYDDGIYIVPHENGTCAVGS
ncbi:MAG: FAD-binding oxidoreductase, partial [Hyphomicrobiaceae bacterium]|nr:FAD-binding oxidoreductase [Hyphomicrobiaceae bacterium]